MYVALDDYAALSNSFRIQYVNDTWLVHHRTGRFAIIYAHLNKGSQPFHLNFQSIFNVS